MPVGFTVSWRPGAAAPAIDVERGGTGPARLISCARDDAGRSAVIMGALTYRGDLARRIGRPVADKAMRSDAEFVLACYRNGGPEGLEQLEGDLALVLHDPITGRLIAHRDPLGGYPLFWARRGGAVRVATAIGPLLDLLGTEELDPEYLAEYLAIPDQRNECTSESCAYRGVRRVQAGTTLVLDLGTGGSATRWYWDWLDRLVEPASSDLDGMAHEYAVRFREAVLETLRGPTLAHLSGGMDSTAVALMGGDLVASKAGAGPLHTISLVYERLPGLARERPYIEEALRRASGIVPHRVVADEFLDFDGFADPPDHDEPYSALWRISMDRIAIDLAAEVGASTVLTGFGADEIHDVQPYHLATLLRRGRLAAAWVEASRWALARRCGAWDLFIPFGLSLLETPRRIGRLVRRAGSCESVPPWVRTDFARRFGFAGRIAARARPTDPRCSRTHLSTALRALAGRAGDVIRWAVAAPAGIAVAHPFLDRRLLALGLGIRDRIPPDPQMMKPVLVRSLNGRLPELITRRRAKGHFGEVYYLGLARNLPYLEAMIRRSRIRDLGVIEVDLLIDALHEASLAGPDSRRLHRLNLVLSLIRWLELRS